MSFSMCSQEQDLEQVREILVSSAARVGALEDPNSPTRWRLHALENGASCDSLARQLTVEASKHRVEETHVLELEEALALLSCRLAELEQEKTSRADELQQRLDVASRDLCTTRQELSAERSQRLVEEMQATALQQQQQLCAEPIALAFQPFQEQAPSSCGQCQKLQRQLGLQYAAQEEAMEFTKKAFRQESLSMQRQLVPFIGAAEERLKQAGQACLMLQQRLNDEEQLRQRDLAEMDELRQRQWDRADIDDLKNKLATSDQRLDLVVDACAELRQRLGQEEQLRRADLELVDELRCDLAAASANLRGEQAGQACAELQQRLVQEEQMLQVSRERCGELRSKLSDARIAKQKSRFTSQTCVELEQVLHEEEQLREADRAKMCELENRLVADAATSELHVELASQACAKLEQRLERKEQLHGASSAEVDELKRQLVAQAQAADLCIEVEGQSCAEFQQLFGQEEHLHKATCAELDELGNELEANAQATDLRQELADHTQAELHMDLPQEVQALRRELQSATASCCWEQALAEAAIHFAEADAHGNQARAMALCMRLEASEAKNIALERQIGASEKLAIAEAEMWHGLHVIKELQEEQS